MTIPTIFICSNPKCRAMQGRNPEGPCTECGKKWSMRVATITELLRHFVTEIGAHSECHCEGGKRDCLYCLSIAAGDSGTLRDDLQQLFATRRERYVAILQHAATVIRSQCPQERITPSELDEIAAALNPPKT